MVLHAHLQLLADAVREDTPLREGSASEEEVPLTHWRKKKKEIGVGPSQMNKTTCLREALPQPTLRARTSTKRLTKERDIFARIEGVTFKCNKGIKVLAASKVQAVEQGHEGNGDNPVKDGSIKPNQAL